MVGVNRASQGGGHLAAVLGDQFGADCLILREIEEDIYAPNDAAKVREVLIERKRSAGNLTLARQTWTRLPNGVTQRCYTSPDSLAWLDLPYALVPNTDGQPAYPESDRCNRLNGCPPDPTTVHNVGVSVVYRHLWATPLNAAFDVFGGGNTGWTITQTNVFRIEPVL
jgi:hypothetical protein